MVLASLSMSLHKLFRRVVLQTKKKLVIHVLYDYTGMLPIKTPSSPKPIKVASIMFVPPCFLTVLVVCPIIT